MVMQKLCKRCEKFELETYITNPAESSPHGRKIPIATIFHKLLGTTCASCALCNLFEEIFIDSQAATSELKVYSCPDEMTQRTHFEITGISMTSRQCTWRLHPTQESLPRIPNTTFSLERIEAYARR
jgi:hypothetical protein